MVKKQSECPNCSQKFNFPVVPYRHLDACSKAFGVPSPNASVGLEVEGEKEGEVKKEGVEFIDPYKDVRGRAKMDVQVLKQGEDDIIEEVEKYFDWSQLSGNQRAMVNRMKEESRGRIGEIFRRILSAHNVIVW